VTVAIITRDFIDAAAIGVVLLINTTLGFVTELRARRAMESLVRLQAPRAVAVRDGHAHDSDARELVPGDVIQIEAGQFVPADARVLESSDLRTVEGALTGESLPVMKAADPLQADTPLPERSNMLYQGTAVADGTARALVVATGAHTELGRIGELAASVRHDRTPLERRLDALGRRLVWLALGAGAVVSALAALRGLPLGQMLETGIALAIAAVPEGLPAVATTALAVGVHRMARRQALIRRLPSAETLGSVTVICTDKTGTLTAGAMAVTVLALDEREITIAGTGYQLVGTFLENGTELDAASDVHVRQALTIGVFLSKPCEPEHLIARVNGLLESRRLRAVARGASGIDILFNGQHFSIPSDKEQILDLLVSTFEDMVRKNQEILAGRDALAAKHEQLLRLEQQKEELSALVVHDLKSPAAGIMMAAQSRLKTSDLSDVERQLWGLVYTSAEVINRMVLNLLDIAGSSDGVFAPQPANVDVPKLVREVQQLMTPVAESLKHQIAVDVASELPRLQADPELLRRVLQNLLDNALRHSPPGEPIRLEADGADGVIRFRVRDRGPGIPQALRERVFDKYVRVGESRGAAGSVGKGLGLAFCRIAVEAHGGRIWVDDNPPQGSVFTVQIPIGQGRAQVGERS
jgi:signal transduction histidine kinase